MNPATKTPRIERLRVSNFRSIGEEQVLDLSPLTVIVGANGAGKSNLADVFSFVRDSLVLGLPAAIAGRGGIEAVRRRGTGQPNVLRISLEVQLSTGPATYELVVGDDSQYGAQVLWERATCGDPDRSHGFHVERGKWIGSNDGLDPRVSRATLTLPAIAGDERYSELYEALVRVVVYSVFPDALRAPQKHSAERPMSRRGENWLSVLDERSEPAWRAELLAGLTHLTGDIDNLQVQSAGGYYIARFHHRTNGHGSWFDAIQESDGTLRVAAILTALLQEPPLSLVGIEEPELAVHPGALPLLVDYLRQASLQSQVLITTHSPELLNCVDPREVRVVTRASAGTEVRRLADGQLGAVRDGLYRLGDLMLVEGLMQQEGPRGNDNP